MSISITTFEAAKHTEVAAALLAGRHRRDRNREPRLPAAFEDERACRGQIEQTLQSKGLFGAIAESGGGPVGFGLMTTTLIESTHMLASFFPARGVGLGYSSFAAAEGMEYDVIRELFGALADEYVSRGYFEFTANVPAADLAVQDAFASLGFGRSMCCAIRDVSPVRRAGASIDVHQASGEDVEVIHQLSDELTLHHAKSPIFNPFIRESDAASLEFQKGLLQDPAANAHWVAYRDGRAVGMNTFMAPFFLSPMTAPDKTIYLYQGIVSHDERAGGVGSAILSKGVEWARAQGYENVALHFATANLSGARFWQSSGFQPIEYGMRRRVDERIAWANR